MRREHHGGPVGHLVELVHEHRAAVLELAHHPGVVHDLLAHVDRLALQLERALDDLDGPLDAGAERPRPGQQDLARPAGGRPPLGHGRGGAQRAQRGQPAGDDARHRSDQGVGHGPDHRHRAVPGRAGQRRRLHVGEQRAVGGQFGPFGPADQVVHGYDPARPGGQPGPAQLAGQQRGGQAGGHADLGADDQVARAEVVGQPGTDAHHDHLAERAGFQLTRTVSRPRGAVARAQYLGRISAGPEPPPDRAGLDAQGGTDDRVGHVSPPWMYLPRALTGKASRYRW